MGIQIIGTGAAIQEIDSGTKAARVSVRPMDHGVNGQYRLSTTVALTAAQAANGTLFSMRWTDATRLMVLQYLQLSVLQTTAATATIMPMFQAFFARGFTANDSAGTAISMAGNAFKKKTSMGSTGLGDVRKSAVAAGLTVGTRTLDADPFLEIAAQLNITTPNGVVYSGAADLTNAADHPIVFAQNEGFIVRGPTTAFGAAGTANLLIQAAWAEVLIASY